MQGQKKEGERGIFSLEEVNYIRLHSLFIAAELQSLGQYLMIRNHHHLEHTSSSSKDLYEREQTCIGIAVSAIPPLLLRSLINYIKS